MESSLRRIWLLLFLLSEVVREIRDVDLPFLLLLVSSQVEGRAHSISILIKLLVIFELSGLLHLAHTGFSSNRDFISFVNLRPLPFKQIGVEMVVLSLDACFLNFGLDIW